MTLGLTQKQVARILNLQSSAQVSRWERGERQPNLIQSLRLSALYKRLVNDLFFDCFNQQREFVMGQEGETKPKKTFQPCKK